MVARRNRGPWDGIKSQEEFSFDVYKLQGVLNSCDLCCTYERRIRGHRSTELLGCPVVHKATTICPILYSTSTSTNCLLIVWALLTLCLLAHSVPQAAPERRLFLLNVRTSVQMPQRRGQPTEIRFDQRVQPGS